MKTPVHPHQVFNTYSALADMKQDDMYKEKVQPNIRI
jgi:hypothetical protein